VSRYTEPDLSSAALITIDVQCDTLDGGALEVPGTSAMLPNLQALLSRFRRTGRPIIHVVRLYRPDGSNVDPCRREAVERGAAILLLGMPGSELAPQVLPKRGMKLEGEKLLGGSAQELSRNEIVLYKPRWGAFFGTPLEQHLDRLGVSTLIVTGANFPNCPRTTIYEASERDYRIVLVEDAISGLYDRGKDEVTGIGVRLMRTRELIDKIGGVVPRVRTAVRVA
jgi:nicotinamidase-related amidase